MRIVLTLVFGPLGLWTLFCLIQFFGAILWFMFGNYVFLPILGALGYICLKALRKRKRRNAELAKSSQSQSRRRRQVSRYSERKSNSA